jgi:hypothetical protein
MHRHSLVPVLLVGATACVRHAPPPQLPHDADLDARESAYASAELTYERTFFTHGWRRADGKYPFAGIDRTVDSYPASRAARKKASNRNLVVTLLSAAGGGFIGVAFGNQFFAQEPDRYSNSTLFTLYGTGLGLALLGEILDQTWTASAYEEIAPAYNDELRRDLALPPIR